MEILDHQILLSRFGIAAQIMALRRDIRNAFVEWLGGGKFNSVGTLLLLQRDEIF